MAEDLQAQFVKAAEDVKKLSNAPDSEMLLKLYGLYKQANKGDCQGKRPGILDPVGRAKFDAWDALKGAPQEEAMRQYIATVNGLIATDK